MDELHVINDGKADFRQKYPLFDERQFEDAWAIILKCGLGGIEEGFIAVDHLRISVNNLRMYGIIY